MTNFERIKAMSVEEMVDRIYNDASIEYCNNLKECANLLDINLIADSMCKTCLRKWQKARCRMRLIDAKALERDVKEAFEKMPVVMGMMLRCIRKQPTIEARPVVRGDWYGVGNMWMCTVCDDQFYVMSNFCPNCGADMRGEDDG